MIQSIHFLSPIGTITITASEVGISNVQLTELVNATSGTANPLLSTTRSQILAYLDGTLKEFTVDLDTAEINGFQHDVFDVVNHIAFGEILTYGQVAVLLHKPQASRAVGSALARNPLPILIPCHRVVAATCHLTGYLGQKGIETKKMASRIGRA